MPHAHVGLFVGPISALNDAINLRLVVDSWSPVRAGHLLRRRSKPRRLC